MTTMERIDTMFREAEVGADQEVGVENLTPVLEVRGVEVNELSKRVVLYRTDTGEPVEVNKINVPAALKKVFNDPQATRLFGKPVFSKVPTMEHKLGHFTCLLHESQLEYRETYAAMGYPPCGSAHLPSQREVIRHMERKHQSEWAAIKADRVEAERQEDRRFQREMVKRLGRVPAASKRRSRAKTKAA